jgi:peptidoglycan/LPS O-acetylase OafA/YrhL
MTKAAALVSLDSTHSGNLDCLRSIAVLAVLFTHLASDAFRTDDLLFHRFHIAQIGQTGVLLFFVHTALVLLRSLRRLHADGYGRVPTRFFLRRIFRIYPLYLAAIAVVLSLPGTSWLGWHRLIANLLFLQNVTFSLPVSPPMWSLAYEMQMYLVLPIIYLIALQKEAIPKLLLLSFFAGASAIAMRVFLSWPFDGVMHEPVSYFVPCFLGGAYAFASRQRKAIPAFLFPFFLVACVSSFSVWPNFPFLQWTMCTVIGFALPAFAELSNKPLRVACHAVATYSYGIYLWHPPLMVIWFYRFELPFPVRLLGFIVSLAVLSVASYHLIETPFIRIGRRIEGREPAPLWWHSTNSPVPEPECASQAYEVPL